LGVTCLRRRADDFLVLVRSDTEQLKVVFAAVEESILKAAMEDLVRLPFSLALLLPRRAALTAFVVSQGLF